MIRDLLVHPYNGNLYCKESIGSLGLMCLMKIVEDVKEISVEGLLYMSMPKNYVNNNVNNVMVESFSNLRN